MIETVEGRRPVYELLKSSQQISKILIASNVKPTGIIAEIEALAKKRGILVSRVERKDIDLFAHSTSHQGVIAIIPTKQEYLSFSDLMLTVDVSANPVLLILDEITDPQNFGALIRTADAAGIAGIIVAKRRSAPITAAVHKASAGATAYVKIAQVSNLVYTIEELKEIGFWIIGASEKADKNIYETDFLGPIAIVLGSEGKGLSRLIKEKCDYLVSIPMKGKVSSLNVSVAGALLMYEALRQREFAKKINLKN